MLPTIPCSGPANVVRVPDGSRRTSVCSGCVVMYSRTRHPEREVVGHETRRGDFNLAGGAIRLDRHANHHPASRDADPCPSIADLDPVRPRISGDNRLESIPLKPDVPVARLVQIDREDTAGVLLQTKSVRPFGCIVHPLMKSASGSSHHCRTAPFRSTRQIYPGPLCSVPPVIQSTPLASNASPIGGAGTFAKVVVACVAGS